MGYRTIDHTADLALEVWAPTQAALLAHGARALVAQLTDDATIEATAERHVSLSALDPEDRLVVWLNEVLFMAVTEGFLFASGDPVLTADGLDAQVCGEPHAADRITSELKSVTYHDLCLDERDGGWFARLIVDV